MKLKILSINIALLIVCFSLSFCQKSKSKDLIVDPPTEEEKPTLPIAGGIRIAWDYSTLRKLSQAGGYNGYARMIQLQDKSLICTYEQSGTIVVVKSSDGGNSWSAPVVVDEKANGINMAVPDILQLKDGSILVCYNPRPYQIAPERKFGIRTKKSYDGGATWTDGRLLYEADYVFENGCWEPSAIQLPSGEIQLFFANENPFRTTSEQNISMVRSTDNGLTWSATAQTVSYRAGARDGMPAPVLLNNGKDIVFAIEDNGFSTFKPYIIRNTLTENWATPVDASSNNRTYALADKIADNIYAGAPYLRQLSSGETILSYQGTEGRTNNLDYAEMKVTIGTSEARSFDRKSVPFNIPPTKSGLWNSVSVIDGNTVVALTSTSGLSSSGATEVWMIKGHVIPELTAANQTIIVDGAFNETAWSGSFPVFVGHKTLTQARAQITYDNDFLYVLTDVKDGNITLNSGNIENSDGTTIYIHAKAQTYASPNKGVFAISVTADNKVVVKEGESGKWAKRDVAGIKSAVKNTAMGYRQEVAIPWAVLGGKPAAVSKIAFNLGLTENGGKETITSCNELQPATWMALTLN